MYESCKVKIRLNLKKANGQLKLVDKMVEEGKNCIQIAQQVNSAIGLLKKVNVSVLENQLQSCEHVNPPSKNSEEKARCIEELIKIFNITGK